MTDRAVVSIVLPTFNGCHYLAEAIESCLTQTYPDWELIIVDDCSSDATPSVIARYIARDPRIRMIRHDTNRGLPAALNTGFRAARGDFLTWTSDDNAYLPEALDDMLWLLSERAEIDIVYADVTYVDDKGDVIRLVPAGPLEDLALRNCVGACFLFRRHVFEGLEGYDEALFMAEDYDFWLRASCRFRFLALHKDLYRYRWHARSLTSRQSAQAQAIVLTLEKNLPKMSWLRRRQRARAYLEMAVRCWQIPDGSRARRCLGQALWLQPTAVFVTRPTLLLGLARGVSLRSFLRLQWERLKPKF